MKLKSAALAFITMLTFSGPALAKGGPTFPVPRHLLMVPFECDDDNFFSVEGFVEFVNKSRKFQAVWGATNLGTDTNDNPEIGFEVHPNGLVAESFQLDWNVSQAGSPYITIVTNDQNGTSQQVGNIGSLGSGFTTVVLPNGFLRITFNAVSNGLPSGSTWNLIQIHDSFQELSVTSRQDVITNMLINGIPVNPDVHAPTKPPIYDCTD